MVEKIKPELTQEEFEKVIEPLFLEYFQHGITQDVIVSDHLAHASR